MGVDVSHTMKVGHSSMAISYTSLQKRRSLKASTASFPYTTQ